MAHERRQTREIGSLVYRITHLLLLALGWALRVLLSAQMSCQPKDRSFLIEKSMRNHPLSQFFDIFSPFNHGIMFWTEYVTAMDLRNIWDFESTVFVGV